jgi:hypothetical protein
MNALSLGTANIAYLQDTGLPVCFAGWQVEVFQTCKPAKQQRCGNFTFRICCLSNLTGLDDRGESLCCIPKIE